MKSNMTEKKLLVQEVFDKVFSINNDLMNDIMSLGSHRLWKKQNRLAGFLLIRIQFYLDMSSGTGDIAKLFLKHIKK